MLQANTVLDPRVLLVQHAVAQAQHCFQCRECQLVTQFNWEQKDAGKMKCTLCKKRFSVHEVGPMLRLWRSGQPFPAAGGQNRTQVTLYPRIAKLLDVIMSRGVDSNGLPVTVPLNDASIARQRIQNHLLQRYQSDITPPGSPKGPNVPQQADLVNGISQLSSICGIIEQEMAVDNTDMAFATVNIVTPVQQPRVVDLESSSSDANRPMLDPPRVADTNVNGVVTSLAKLVQQTNADREEYLACFQCITSKIESLEQRLIEQAAVGTGCLTTENRLLRQRYGSATVTTQVDTNGRLMELHSILQNYPESKRHEIKSALLKAPKFRMFATDGLDLGSSTPEEHGLTALFVRELPCFSMKELRDYLKYFGVNTYFLLNISFIGRSVVELLFRDNYVEEAKIHLTTGGFKVMSADEFNPLAAPPFANAASDVQSAISEAYRARLSAIVGRNGVSARVRLYYAALLEGQRAPGTVLALDTQLVDDLSPLLVDATHPGENETRKRLRVDDCSEEY